MLFYLDVLWDKAIQNHKKRNIERSYTQVDEEKKILMGPALIPNKKIYRKFEEQEYFIYFSENTVKKAAELFLTKGKQNNSTLEHKINLKKLEW